MRGWSAWHELYQEQVAQRQMLASAGARLLRPKLAASFSHWKTDWEVEVVGARAKSDKQLLAEQKELSAALEASLRRLRDEMSEERIAMRQRLAAAAEHEKAARAAAHRADRLRPRHVRRVRRRRVSRRSPARRRSGSKTRASSAGGRGGTPSTRSRSLSGRCSRRPARASCVRSWRRRSRTGGRTGRRRRARSRRRATSSCSPSKRSRAPPSRLSSVVSRRARRRARGGGRAAALAAEHEKTALERLRAELSGSAEEQAAAREAAAKEKRVEELSKKARADQESGHHARLVGVAGKVGGAGRAPPDARSRLRPKLAASMAAWRKDWADTVNATGIWKRSKMAEDTNELQQAQGGGRSCRAALRA